MKTLGIIPAKGYSKGIPNKNLRDLGGKPLVQWTIEAAKESSLDLVVVTTDDDSIGGLAVELGIEAFERPVELSQDFVQVDEVVLHTLRTAQHLWKDQYDTVVVLQPTSPFRSAEHIDEALRFYADLKRTPWYRSTTIADTVFSAYESRKYAYRRIGLGTVEPIGHDPKLRLGREDDDETRVLIENGAIYIVDAQRLSRERTFRALPMVPYIMSTEESLELDEPIDWELAELLIQKGIV